jgi:hypothetical protein
LIAAFPHRAAPHFPLLFNTLWGRNDDLILGTLTAAVDDPQPRQVVRLTAEAQTVLETEKEIEMTFCAMNTVNKTHLLVAITTICQAVCTSLGSARGLDLLSSSTLTGVFATLLLRLTLCGLLLGVASVATLKVDMFSDITNSTFSGPCRLMVAT